MNATPRPTAPTSGPAVLIVGAGPVGMTLGCELLNAGVNVRLISHPRRHSPHSRATILWPRILELLDRTGVTAALVDAGHYFDQMNYYSEKRPIGRIRFDRLAGVQYPYAITCPQWKIEDVLEDRFRTLGGTIDYGVDFVSGAQDPHHVRCRLRNPNGQVVDESYSWLIGADGYTSTVRSAFGFTFSGRSLQTRLAITDAEVIGETTSSEAAYYLTRGGNMVLAPLGDGIFRVGTTVPDDYGGHDQPDRQFFETLLAQRVPHARRLGHMNFSGIFTANIRSATSYRNGRVFLCGDAAHAMSPSGAQGLNTGLQDATNLGWKLAGVARGDYPEQLLESYDTDRRPAVARVSNLSTSLARIGLYRSRPKIWARDTLYRLGTITGEFERRLAPHLAQTTTYYGNPPKHGNLTVGQRLPLGWQSTTGEPTLDRNRYTLIMWPGRTYHWTTWNSFVASIRTQLPSTHLIDLAGRPPGALQPMLPPEAIALICRPDGHLQRVLQPQLDAPRIDASRHAITTAIAQLHANSHDHQPQSAHTGEENTYV